MDQDFAAAERLAPDRLRVLQRRRNGPGVARLSAQGALYLGAAIGLALGPPPAAVAALLVLSAVAQFAMFGMLHEAAHRTAFRTPALNELAGWFAALAHPMSPALMRAFHFEHHRHTHELARDPELAGMRLMLDWPRGVIWVGTVTGVPILAARLYWTLFAAFVPASALWDRVLPFVPPSRRRRVAWEARALVAVHAAIVTLAATAVPGLAWIYAGMLGGHALTAFYTTCEHRGLPEGGSILDRTRSLRAPAWLRWLLWNMPYHAEHHGWPSVPFHALGELHAEVREALVHRAGLCELHRLGGRPRA